MRVPRSRSPAAGTSPLRAINTAPSHAAVLPPSILPRDAHVVVSQPLHFHRDAEFVTDELPQLPAKWRATVFPSLRPTGREEVEHVERWLEQELAAHAAAKRAARRAEGAAGGDAARAGPDGAPPDSADATGRMAIEEDFVDAGRISTLYRALSTGMHELCRQVTVDCADRGRVLWRVWTLACNTIERLLTLIDNARRAHRDMVANEQSRLMRAQREIDSLGAQLEAQCARTDEAEATVARLRGRYDGLVVEAARLQRLASEVDALVESREQLDNLVQEMKAEAATKDASTEALSSRVRRAERALSQLTFEKEAADESLGEMKARVIELEAENEAQRAEVRRKASELEDVRKGRDEAVLAAKRAAKAAEDAERVAQNAISAQQAAEAAAAAKAKGKGKGKARAQQDEAGGKSAGGTSGGGSRLPKNATAATMRTINYD